MAVNVLLLSDTHGHIDQTILKYADWADEVWHAGDVGTLYVLDTIKEYALLRSVYGNIDSHEIRREIPETHYFNCEQLSVFMIHIGGYPGRYEKSVKALLQEKKPNLYICGHSHILKVMRDEQLNLLHINPGACGVHGFHHMRTMVRFTVKGSEISNLEVIEIGPRAALRV